MDFYIGSYTRMGGPGVARCNLEGEKITMLTHDPLPNATYVILNRAKNRLFAISSDPVSGEEGGSAASYDVTGGCLRLLSRQNTLGAGPCHLCLDEGEHFLYTANYFSGSVSVFPVDGEGNLGPCIQHVQHQGRGTDPERQAGPHAHQVSFLPGERLLCAVDLGLDALFVYDQNPETGLLTLKSQSPMPLGSGPRHLLYGKKDWAYLCCELGNLVLKLKWNGQQFERHQALSTLPSNCGEESAAAAIRMTRDGKKLLISNRGYDSIAVFAIDEEGSLTLQKMLMTPGFPRDFALVDDETLLIGHQKGTLTLEKIAGDSLQKVSELPIPGCVCTLIP